MLTIASSLKEATLTTTYSSYFILPSGNTDVKPMDPSVKKWIKWMRIVQLVLRCLELLCSVGLLVMMILIRKVDASTGWILRVVVSCGRNVVHSEKVLTSFSLALPFSTQSTVSITWEGSLLEEPQHHLRPICYSQLSSTYPLCHFMSSALWFRRLRNLHGLRSFLTRILSLYLLRWSSI